MGLFICEKHGKTSGKNVCKHIRNNTEENRPSSSCSLKYEIMEGSFIEYFFCDDCKLKFGIPETGNTIPFSVLVDENIPENESDPYQDAVGELVLICGQCFNEANQIKSREEGDNTQI